MQGGRWTVFRFFLVSIAFTSAWLAVSSQLDYYRKLHGPQVSAGLLGGCWRVATAFAPKTNVCVVLQMDVGAGPSGGLH